jgi:hypothetical protein
LKSKRVAMSVEFNHTIVCRATARLRRHLSPTY